MDVPQNRFKSSIAVTETHVMEVDKGLLLQLLRTAGIHLPSNDAVHVTVDVPSGGDYSGATLSLEVDTCVRVEWTVSNKNEK